MNPKEFRSQRSGKSILSPKGFWVFIPNPLPPDLTWSLPLVTMLTEAERELSRLTARVSGFPFPHLLIQPFIRSEAVISSRIEGTRASLEDVFNYEVAQLSFFERTDDVREVHNYVRAMNHGLERLKTLPVSLRLIREVHGKLMEGVRGGKLNPGEFRVKQNWIGAVGSTLENATYVPPPVEEMEAGLDALEKFIHSNVDIPALVRAGLIHYQFEALHPFLDGNGRVGRLLIILLLCEWGLLQQPMLNLSAYIERYRQTYYDLLLSVSQKGDWEEWLIFFLRGVRDQAKEGVWRIDRLQALRADYEPIIRRDRNVARMAGVVDFLFSRPILSTRQLAEGLGMPFKTASDYLVKLEHAGVVREVSGRARSRIFHAEEILRAVEEKVG